MIRYFSTPMATREPQLFLTPSNPSRVAMRLAGWLPAALILGACASAPEPEPETPKWEYAEDEPDDGMEVMQEFGGMNQEKVEKTVHGLYPQLADCLMQAQRRVDFLGGEVAFLVKVNRAGEAEAAHAERSTLGDFQAEQCMLDKMRAARWPKPVGGLIGLARTSIAFDPPEDVRPPVAWTQDDIAATLEANRDQLATCGPSGQFEVTAYVDTDGTVMTAGVAHADDAADGTASCLVGAVQELTFDSPGSWPAKVSFRM